MTGLTNERLNELSTMTGGDSGILEEAIKETAEMASELLSLRAVLDGLPPEAIAGGWTAKGISDYAKKLEAQLAELAKQPPFMYGIEDPDGKAYFDEFCVSADRGLVEDAVNNLNHDREEGDELNFTAVELFTRAVPQAVSQPDEPVQWGAPKNVRQLIQQLQTLDPELETTALLRMPADFRDGRAIRQVPLSISYEKMDGMWLAPYKGDGRKVLAFWVKPDDRSTAERGKYLTSSQPYTVPAEITYEQACLEVSKLSPAEAYMKAWNARGAVSPLSGHRFSDAILNVINERQRQINAEGWTPKHDDRHTDGALALAASCYAYVAAIQSPGGGMSYEEWPKLKFWPWDEEWWKPTDPRRDLVKAAALIIAEIERIDRSGCEGGFHD